jgi:hypothetical protein
MECMILPTMRNSQQLVCSEKCTGPTGAYVLPDAVETILTFRSPDKGLIRYGNRTECARTLGTNPQGRVFLSLISYCKQSNVYLAKGRDSRQLALAINSQMHPARICHAAHCLPLLSI